MRTTTWAAILFGPLVAVGEVGCNSFGPDAVRGERPTYNDAIHETAVEQTFLNIVRVKHHQTTFFMDVSEVDASLQFQTQGSASLSFPQAMGAGHIFSGHDYGIGGSLQYQESPTIRFQPLTGAALIAQVASPITVDSIASLYDSDWPLGPLLDLAADRLTPHAEDNDPALNAIMELDSYEALVLAAVKSPISIAPGGSAGRSPAQSGGGSTPPNDTLVLFFEPQGLVPHGEKHRNEAVQAAARLWARLLRIYADTLDGPDAAALPASLALLESGQFDPRSNNKVPRSIDLRTAPVDPGKCGGFPPSDLAPVLRMHSALGVLRSAANEFPRFAFVDRQKLDSDVWGQSLLASHLRDSSYFYSIPEGGNVNDLGILKFVSDDPRFHLDLDIDGAKIDLRRHAQMEDERELADSRRYIVVFEDDNPPPTTAFVATKMDVVVTEGGKVVKKTKYFYIDGVDHVSQRNFALISQFLTIQATPSQTPPLTPSLSVGGRGS